MKRGTPDHPKTLALQQALGVDKAKACGTLELLWQFTARYAPRGDIGKWPDAKIAEAVAWQGDPGVLISALVQTGWIDSEKTYRLLIHDWSDHCEQTTKRYLSKHNLRFATKSGRRPAFVRPPTSTPLPLPEPVPEPVPVPNDPPFPPAGAGGHEPTEPPPEPTPPPTPPDHVRADHVVRVARAARAKWDPGGPLDRQILRRIRTALKSTPVDEVLREIEASDRPPPWMVVVERVRL